MRTGTTARGIAVTPVGVSRTPDYDRIAAPENGHVFGKSIELRCPYWVIAVLESALGALPYALRNRIADTKLMRALLGLRVAAIKPCAGTVTGRQTGRTLRGNA